MTAHNRHNQSPIVKMLATRPTVLPGLLQHWYAWPAIILGLMFTFGPICVIVAFSFMSQPESGGGVLFKFSADAYKQLLFSSDFTGHQMLDLQYVRVFGTSLWQALLTTAVCLVLSFPVALWMSLKDQRKQQILVMLVMIPFWTNALVQTYAWMLVLNDNGPVNGILQYLGVGVRHLLYTPFASVLGLIYSFLPFAILPMYSALSGFDFRLVEAAYDLGARKLTVMRRIILREVRPGIISAITLCLIPSFGSYLQPVLLGGGKVLMVGNLIDSQFTESRNWPFGAAVSTTILVIVLICGIVISVIGGRASHREVLSL